MNALYVILHTVHNMHAKHNYTMRMHDYVYVKPLAGVG